MGFIQAVTPEPAPRPAPTGPRVPPSDAYTASALRGELDKLESAPEGQRNHTLFTSAAALAEFVNAGTLDEYDVRDDLTASARRIGLSDGEIMQTINSAFKKTEGIARSVPEKPAAVLTPSVSIESPPEPSRGRFADRLLSPTNLKTLPDPKPMIDETLDQGTTALLYGKFASSKSFIALDWACSVASGRSWMGRKTEQTKVLYIVAEGVAGIPSRINAWEVGWRTPLSDEWIRFLPMPVNLMTRDIDQICQVVEEGGFGFVVFDTLARCMVGGDENSAKDAGVVIDGLTRVMYSTPDRRGVVIGVHHTGKDGKTLRGSSAFESGVDTVYFAERNGTAVSLKRTKRKDGPEHDQHSLKLTEIAGTDSCIVDTYSAAYTEMTDSEAVAKLKNILLQMFVQTGVSNSDLKAVAMEQGMSFTEYGTARAALFREGFIVQSDPNSKRWIWLVVQRDETIQ